jgi:hypothetical protein
VGGVTNAGDDDEGADRGDDDWAKDGWVDGSTVDGSPVDGSTVGGPAVENRAGGRLRIGPGEAGGRNGTSIVSVLPSDNSFEPAVIAAKVGTDANPTRSATMSTYRRVGPENPLSAR